MRRPRCNGAPGWLRVDSIRVHSGACTRYPPRWRKESSRRLCRVRFTRHSPHLPRLVGRTHRRGKAPAMRGTGAERATPPVAPAPA